MKKDQLPQDQPLRETAVSSCAVPKKLIRKEIVHKLKIGEWEFVEDKNELNKLYAIKVREELAEIQESDHKDIFEFVDLIQVAFAFAKQNGFTHEMLASALIEKTVDKGNFSNIALNNLNPDNPSNKLYFKAKNDLNSQISKVEDLINFFHNDLAKSIVDMKTYSPLSSDLIKIKDKLSDLKTTT